MELAILIAAILPVYMCGYCNCLKYLQTTIFLYYWHLHFFIEPKIHLGFMYRRSKTFKGLVLDFVFQYKAALVFK